jgi:predicted choloylglycine hydrolase
MKTTSILICLALFLYAANSQPYHAKWGPRTTPAYGHAPPHYIINMDLNYTAKWQEIMTDMKENMTNVIKTVFETYHIPSSIGDLPYSTIEKYDLAFAQECQAIADLIGVKVGLVFILNFMYEASAFCTSIVTQTSTGEIFHARNLDYPMAPAMANIAFSADWYQNGTLLYSATTFAGFLGVITGEKPGAFGISANQRDTMNTALITSWIIGLSDNVYDLFWEHRKGMAYTIRQVLENATDYNSAIQLLADSPIIAPVYYIVSGVNSDEGAVITMNRDSVANLAMLDVEGGIWYLVQTNYDRDVPDPADDNRRTAAQNRLDAIGQDAVSIDNVMSDVQSLYPNFNNETILTGMYSAQQSYFNVTMWY